MMTIDDVGAMLDLLEANYGKGFYDGVDRKKVLKTWAVMFKDDDPTLVMTGVRFCINTLTYKPTIADIRKRMAQVSLKGQMSEMEAWHRVRKAIDSASNRNDAIMAFNAMPSILRKLVVDPSRLRSWYKCSDDTLEGVIASNVQRSYRKLVQDEADFYALPKDLQKAEQWLIDHPSFKALPEPKHQKTADDILDEMERKTKEYRDKYGLKPNPAYADRVEVFKGFAS